MIAGVDEAGRGPLAGPVVAAAVVLCADGIPGVDDSKKLSAAQREALFALIMKHCVVGIGIASVEEIDAINILWATMRAMERAVDALGAVPREVLVDGNRCPNWGHSSRAIVGGDALEPCISAASIVAKVTRDRIMLAHHAAHPGYNWAANKGYATADHREALARLGPTALHRRSFAPVREALLAP